MDSTFGPLTAFGCLVGYFGGYMSFHGSVLYRLSFIRWLLNVLTLSTLFIAFRMYSWPGLVAIIPVGLYYSTAYGLCAYRVQRLLDS